ncbi:unnamed protein product [Absidia cylindrospora]
MRFKDRTAIGETELLTAYFDPILCISLLANPEKNVLLRRANVMTDASKNKRPDATISYRSTDDDATITQMMQMNYGPTLGFGEGKVAQNSCDKFMLCHDLLRLAIFFFWKGTIDDNKLDGAVAFQVHGFGITFFMTRLEHDGIYVMFEIAHLTFPRSLDELIGFVNI